MGRALRVRGQSLEVAGVRHRAGRGRIAVVAIGMAIGLGVPGRDALALVLVIAACAYVVFRVWREEHRY